MFGAGHAESRLQNSDRRGKPVSLIRVRSVTVRICDLPLHAVSTIIHFSSPLVNLKWEIVTTCSGTSELLMVTEQTLKPTVKLKKLRVFACHA